jgi:hypothetical protein
VDAALVAEAGAELRRLDRIDVADNVRHRYIGGGELLDVTLLTGEPADGGSVAALGHDRPSLGRHRREGVVVQLALAQHRDLGIEQLDQLAEDTGFGLAAEAEQDEVVAAEKRVDDLRGDALVVADDAGEDGLPRLEAFDQVGAQLVLDPAAGTLRPLGRPEFAKRGRFHGRFRWDW